MRNDPYGTEIGNYEHDAHAMTMMTTEEDDAGTL